MIEKQGTKKERDAAETTAELSRIKKNIERSVLGSKENNKRFHHFQRFAFKSGLSASDKASANAAERPIIEFNIVNAPISRQCGEFSKQEPSIDVRAAWGTEVNPKVIEVVDGHIRHIFDEAKKRNTQYLTYRDSVSGGFSQFKVWTEYAHELSFDQVIKFGRTYNPTMTGFDPMAKEADKSDAEFAFELYPMDREQFKKDHPKINIDSLEFTKLSEGMFNWSYKDQEQYIIMLAAYYEKIKTKKTIVKLANNRVMLKTEYEEEVDKWIAEGNIAQPPAITDERESEFINIKRSVLMDSQFIEQKDTTFKHLNLVFVDGDSVIIQDEEHGHIEQFTKPYIYHAEGLQRMTNFTGQTIANDFENMVQNKFMIAEEALPTQEDAIQAWDTPQKASLLVYKAYSDINPDKQLPPPVPVPRVPLPPEVVQTFNNSMAMLQNILGSYDASLAQNEQQISGIAIVEAATLSNAAAMPFVVNYMQSLNQVANIIVDIMPKYYKTERTIPIIKKDGTRDFALVNPKDGRLDKNGNPGVDLNYDSNSLQVTVEAGVNFAIAKNKALQQLTLLMKVSPQFAEFMNEVGLETLLDNIEFRNADLLRAKVKEWIAKKAEEKKHQPDPAVIEAKAKEDMAETQKMIMQNEIKKTELKGEEISSKATLETERLILEKEKADNDRLEIMMKAGESKDKLEASIAKAEAEETRAAADLHLKTDHQSHTQFKELGELAVAHHIATKPEPKKEGKE